MKTKSATLLLSEWQLLEPIPKKKSKIFFSRMLVPQERNGTELIALKRVQR
jgi:hypothetical protein